MFNLKNIIFKIVTTSCLLLLGIFFCWKLFTTKDIKKEDVLILGTNCGFAPYEIINDNGDIEGFDIDVAKEIANKMGKKLVVKDMGFDSLILQLKQNKIDFVIAAMSIIPSRLKEIEMVHYHGEQLQFLTLVFWKQIPVGVKSACELKDQIICVQPGSIQEECLLKHNFTRVKTLENVADLIMDIKYGKSIAAVLEPLVVVSLQKKYSELKALNFELGKEDKTLGHGVGIKKDNTNLICSVEEIVKELKANGAIEKLEKKWFKK